MEHVDELMQAWEQLDRDTLIAKATEAIDGLKPFCKNADPEDDGQTLLNMFILTAFFADCVMDDSKLMLLSEVTDLNGEHITQILPVIEEKMPEFQSNSTIMADTNVAACFIMLTLAFAALSGNMNEHVRAFLSDFIQ